MEVSAVSPNYTDKKLRGGSLDDKIDVFEDQLRGWILQHARALTASNYNASQHSGLAVLILALTYFEPIWCYITGEDSSRRSGEFFNKGFADVFGGLKDRFRLLGIADVDGAVEKLEDTLYFELRNGLFHEAMIRSRVIIRRDPNLAPISYAVNESTGAVGSIVIDPPVFLSYVEKHFNYYVKRLRNPSETDLRNNFERYWDHRMARPAPVFPTDEMRKI